MKTLLMILNNFCENYANTFSLCFKSALADTSKSVRSTSKRWLRDTCKIENVAQPRDSVRVTRPVRGGCSSVQASPRRFGKNVW